jgi:hypothetical protein
MAALQHFHASEWQRDAFLIEHFRKSHVNSRQDMNTHGIAACELELDGLVMNRADACSVHGY